MELSALSRDDQSSLSGLEQQDLRVPGPGAPREVRILGGLPPFKQECFILHDEPDAPPFFRLDAREGELAFHVLNPFDLVPDYAPEISPEDERALDLKDGEQPEVWVIVNLNRGASHATVNLAAPILMNVRNGVARQIIPVNAHVWPVRKRLFEEE